MTVQRNDWSLQRKGIMDQERHRERVREAIRKNLGSIVSNESIILSDGKKTVKIPIRSLDEYKFRYNYRKQKQVGQGNGNSKVGDVIAKEAKPGKGATGQGSAGSAAGQEYYEAEVDIDELAGLIFEDLQLPYLQEKAKKAIPSTQTKFTEIRRAGVLSNLDKRRTILENIRRNARERKKAEIGGFKKEDLRFKTWEQDVKYESNAVVIAMMDVSGSMGEFKKYVARSFYFWMVRFLKTKYDNVDIVFISHHTEAKEVTEEQFFTQGESGGTVVSSAYKLALSIIKERYNPRDWNIYPFHFSDGDNYYSDNDEAVKLADELISTCNLFGYGEIGDEGASSYRRSSGALLSIFRDNLKKKDRFIGVRIDSKEDVYPALKQFFGKRGTRI
ncbi:MAG: sporulation protein YhbH [Acidobacteriota bacterium]|nr:sporulation protein YhbH [Blastocatellia bacterium]MDW8412327.1 sporulation protein YhbH [Acidobacteriota bacterium]